MLVGRPCAQAGSVGCVVGVDPDDGKRWLHHLREYAMRRRGEAMLMGEANVALKDIESFFEDHGDALHLQLGFLINQRVWLALARGDASPLEDLIRRLPVPPHDAGWGTFLRNHDELTLDKLEPAERAEVFAAFAPQEDMRIYGHGIRRRTASMLGGDGPRLRMAWSLLFSLPGTPVLLYGDEIGMVEDLGIKGRYAVRRPIDWDAVDEQRGPDQLGSYLVHRTCEEVTREQAHVHVRRSGSEPGSPARRSAARSRPSRRELRTADSPSAGREAAAAPVPSPRAPGAAVREGPPSRGSGP